MAKGSRRFNRGNVIAERLNMILDERGWGSLNELLARLHQVAGTPGFEELGEMPLEILSRIRKGKRVCYDYEAAAIAQALGVDFWWLIGLSNHRELPQHVAPLLPKE